MKETIVKKQEVLPGQRVNSDPQDMSAKGLFSGLNLAGLVEQLNTVLSDDHCLQVESKPGGQTAHGLFHGLHVEEAFKNITALNQPDQMPNVVTVCQYLDEWVSDNYPDPKTAEGRTRAGYEGYIRDYIKPQLGDIPLSELTPRQTHRFVNWLKKDARSLKTKRPLSQTTQAHVCACLSKAMNDAVRDEIIPRNPLVVKVSLPKSSDTPMPYIKKELNILLAAKDIPFYSLIATVALTGARPGELMAGLWKDYDFDSGTLTIEHSLENHSHTIKDTKTHQKRSVPLLELNRAILLEHYKSSKFTKPDDFIWANKSGGPLNESLVSRHFTQSIRKLGLRKIRFYDLKHGHITELLNDGVPDKQIQERVGHSSATMTKDRYGHFVVGAQEKSIRTWERARFSKTAASEPGASDRSRTYDKRFTKPLLYH
jgi:integrase